MLLGACVFILVFYRLSVRISDLKDANIALTQRVAILEYQQRLENEEPKKIRQRTEAPAELQAGVLNRWRWYIAGGRPWLSSRVRSLQPLAQRPVRLRRPAICRS